MPLLIYYFCASLKTSSSKTEYESTMSIIKPQQIISKDKYSFERLKLHRSTVPTGLNCDVAAVMEKWDAALSLARLDPIMLIGAAVSIGRWA